MIFGKYQLLDILGRGGMAEVYKAKSYGVEGFEKLLVIKRILPNLTDNSRFVDMFINEAKIAVSLNHANIVQVFDLGKVADSYYIAMEYVHGMDFASIIKACARTGRKIPVELAAFIGSEVAKGLDYAHRRRDSNLEPLNIIHRDISPHNILISYEGEVKITDFGIAKAKNTLVREEKGTIKGKYAYMAPEQARAKEHDKRVDLFSLGVVLYEAISGTNPLRGGQIPEILRRIENKSYRRLSDACKEIVPQEIEEIVAQAMEPNADDRFFGAGDFYEAIIAFLYNTRTRVGAHSLSSFLDELREDEKKIPTDGVNGEHLIMDLGASTSSTAGSEVNEESSEITSIQVPTAVISEDTSTTTTGTGTSSLSAERREVTVLAMEFIGPPATAETLERFRTIIFNNGGSVVEERSDLLVGIFGLDVADGRDTQDSLDTALKLQRAAMVEESALALQIGIGVYPAKIVLMASGDPREDDAYFDAVSDARSLAKRGIGWVITTDAGRQLTNTSFRFEDVTVTTVDGVEQTVCKVVGRRPVAESYGRLFGRREELRTIGEVLALVSRGSGSVLQLVGEAGTGKTRIMHEVRRRLVAGGHDVGWYEAVCVPWRHATPFAAVIAMFRSILAVGEIEPEQELRAKVERLRELGLIPEEVESVAMLLGVAGERDVGPEERGRQLRSALVRAASSLCVDKMTIFFWDDLGYVDKESLEILKYLSQSLSRMPLLLALATRPVAEYDFANGPACHDIGLNPLSENESKRLTLSRMHARRAPEDLLIDVALKSGGNPLYIEEYVKALIASHVVNVQGGEATYKPEASLVDFPKTLRGLVGARIKRLPIEQRGMLQRAAVMGQRFNADLFSVITGIEIGILKTIMLGLVDMGLLTRISANEFAFASDLVRDVVYDGIILSDRKEIHATVARAIEDLYEDRLDDFVERLAVHYREGGERTRAVDYLIRAGEKVAMDYSHQAALDYYRKALELLQNVPRPNLDRILSVYVPIGQLTIKTNNLDLGQKKMRLAEELAEETGDTRKLIQILRLNAEIQARSDHYLESQQYFQRAIELADELGEEKMRCEVRITAGQVYIWTGDMKKAVPYYREALELSSSSKEPDLFITSSAQLAKALAMSEQDDEALEILSKAGELIDTTENPNTRCEFEFAHSYVYYMRRDMEQAVHYNMRSLEIAKEYDIKDMVARNAHNIGDVCLAQGDYRKAFTYLRMSVDVAEEAGLDLLLNLNNIFLSFIDALKFGSNEGLAKLEKALTIANERNTVWEQVQVHYFLGRIHFERKQYDSAKTHLEQTIRIGRAAENKVYDAPAMDLLTQINETRGKR
ncbi:MAG: protein kinase [Deltaproteobacteria bacterium]|nr:protein kinase [Deltaproteobacteria bacterium]